MPDSMWNEYALNSAGNPYHNYEGSRSLVPISEEAAAKGIRRIVA
jgi:hypothetical protein